MRAKYITEDGMTYTILLATNRGWDEMFDYGERSFGVNINTNIRKNT